MAITQGTWGSLGGFGGLDFGLTEKYAPWLGVNPNQTQGQVAGATTSSGPGGAYPQPAANYPQPAANYPQPAASGGQVLGTTDVPQESPQQPSGPSAEDLLRGQYNNYYGYLDSLMSGLDPQKASQEQIAQGSYDQGYNTLQNQYNTSRSDIESNQSKNLLDLEDSLRTIFRQGNAYLGTRGASDSSAANMYSYALAREGSKQRGGIMGETSRILQNLKGTFDTETKNLQTGLQSKLAEISQWYVDAQNQVRGMKADAQRQFSTEALNYAQQLAQQAQQAYSSQKNVLDTWALNKAQNLPELQQMLSSNTKNMPQYSGLFGTPTNSYSNTGMGMTGYGYGDEEKQI